MQNHIKIFIFMFILCISNKVCAQDKIDSIIKALNEKNISLAKKDSIIHSLQVALKAYKDTATLYLSTKAYLERILDYPIKEYGIKVYYTDSQGVKKIFEDGEKSPSIADISKGELFFEVKGYPSDTRQLHLKILKDDKFIESVPINFQKSGKKEKGEEIGICLKKYTFSREEPLKKGFYKLILTYEAHQIDRGHFQIK